MLSPPERPQWWLRLPQSATIATAIFEVMDECFTEMEHHLAAEQEKVKDTGLPKQSNLEYGGLGRQVK